MRFDRYIPMVRKMLMVSALTITTVSAAAEDATELRIEWLTTVEVAQAVANGKRRAIVIAGSTEQNGAHLVIGKHNRVAEWLAVKLARELGDALVYPTLPFAPTGDPVVRSGHMAYPGSVSLRRSSYRAVFEDLVTSAVASGFREVLLLADHGEGQDILHEIARVLDQAMLPHGVRVRHVSAIYDSAEGEHAGREDTDMLAAIASIEKNDRMIRTGKLPVVTSPSAGLLLLQARLDAALAQVRSFDAER